MEWDSMPAMVVVAWQSLNLVHLYMQGMVLVVVVPQVKYCQE
jgi:hypothetical protein